MDTVSNIIKAVYEKQIVDMLKREEHFYNLFMAPYRQWALIWELKQRPCTGSHEFIVGMCHTCKAIV